MFFLISLNKNFVITKKKSFLPIFYFFNVSLFILIENERVQPGERQRESGNERIPRGLSVVSTDPDLRLNLTNLTNLEIMT